MAKKTNDAPEGGPLNPIEKESGRRFIVLTAFTEVRSGRSYQPGDVVLDPAWHAKDDRRAEARAARGQVKILEVKE